jgi:hypothetical protein
LSHKASSPKQPPLSLLSSPKQAKQQQHSSHDKEEEGECPLAWLRSVVLGSQVGQRVSIRIVCPRPTPS